MNLDDDAFIMMGNTIKNPYIDEWKKKQKRVIGYYCTYIPEELLHAADILPYRIRSTGGEDTTLGDIYMVRFTCSFVRMTLDLALKGGFDFLDGLLMSNSCDHARRMYELFDLRVFTRKEFQKKPPLFYTSIPHVITPHGFEYYKNQVISLKKAIEEKFNIKSISDEKLMDSIKIYNKNRQLFRELYSLRRLDSPKLSGSQALKISMANTSVPKEIANKEIERIWGALKTSEGIKEKRKRIMIVGSDIDNTSFIDIIEGSGGLVVADYLCSGARNILDDIPTKMESSPLEEIIKRVYYRMSCPRMMDDHIRRLDFVKKEIKEAKIDGVIVQRVSNCDLHGNENMILEHELKEIEVPVYNLDRENYQKDYSRIQNRIEAFLEML